MSTLAEKCSRPVTLSKTLVDVRTGEATDGGTFQKACGTRLASRCPSCSEVYRRDLMTVIGEGLDLDKHPGEAVHFLTLTAPGADHFGETHNRPVMRRTDGTTYVRPCGCGVVHAEDAKVLGTPLDPDAYDYTAAAEWNAKASRLFAVTMQRLSRLAYPRTGDETQQQLARFRVVEFQRRGLVHFHVLVRGPLTLAMFETVVRGRGKPGEPGYIKPTTSRGIGWGPQCDMREVKQDGEHGVGHYLLKVAAYAIKGAGDDGADLGAHGRSMSKEAATTCTCDHFATCHDGPDQLVVPTEGGTPLVVQSEGKKPTHSCTRHRLARRGWGYRGHVSSASRNWGTTLGDVRARRVAHCASAADSPASPPPTPNGEDHISPTPLLVIWRVEHTRRQRC